MSTDAEIMKAASMSLDLILNTVSAEHQVAAGHFDDGDEADE